MTEDAKHEVKSVVRTLSACLVMQDTMLQRMALSSAAHWKAPTACCAHWASFIVDDLKHCLAIPKAFCPRTWQREHLREGHIHSSLPFMATTSELLAYFWMALQVLPAEDPAAQLQGRVGALQLHAAGDGAVRAPQALHARQLCPALLLSLRCGPLGCRELLSAGWGCRRQ